MASSRSNRGSGSSRFIQNENTSFARANLAYPMKEAIGNQIYHEGRSIFQPPAFDGKNYQPWKARMRLFIDFTDFDMWKIIENGYHVPREGGVDLPRDSWSPEQTSQCLLNVKAMHYLACALSNSEFDKIYACSTAKEMWDTLAIAHGGTEQFNEVNKRMLTSRFEMFEMEEHESIDEMFGRFQRITNGFKSLGKTIPSSDQVRKILSSLPEPWFPMVTAIKVKQCKDLTTMKLDELLGHLKDYELNLCEDE